MRLRYMAPCLSPYIYIYIYIYIYDYIIYMYYIIYVHKKYILVVLGFELRALCLQSSCYTPWATPPALFALVILEIWSHFLPRLASGLILQFKLLQCHWNYRLALPCPVFSHWNGVLQICFCLSWSRTLLSLWYSLKWQACVTMPSYWLRWGLLYFLLRLTSNHNSPDFRCEPLVSCYLLVLWDRV
jgi:hypothetical protein